MCRRLTIDFEWEDGDEPGLFDPAKNFDDLLSDDEDQLHQELSLMFSGQITMRVGHLPRG